MLKPFIIFITCLISYQLSFANSFVATSLIDAAGAYQEKAFLEKSTGENKKKVTVEGTLKKTAKRRGV